MSAAVVASTVGDAGPSRVDGANGAVRSDRAAIVAVIVAAVAVAAAQGLTFPLIAVLLQERGAASSQIAAHGTALMLGLALSVVALPALTARYGAGALLGGALAAAALAVLGFVLTDGNGAWLALRMVLGFCVNTVYVAGEAWLGRATAPHRRGRVSGIYNAALAGGFCVGPLAIPLLGSNGPMPLLACAGLLAASALATVALSRRAGATRGEPTVLADLPRFAVAAPGLLVLILVFGAIDAVALALLPARIAAESAAASSGDGAREAALFVAVMHLGMMVAQPAIGAAVDRIGARCVSALCLLVTAAAFGAMAVAPGAVLPLAAIGGAAFMGIHTCALTALVSEHRGPGLVAGTVAFSLAYSAGATVGLTGAGAAADLAPAAGIGTVLLACLIGLLALCGAGARTSARARSATDAIAR